MRTHAFPGPPGDGTHPHGTADSAHWLDLGTPAGSVRFPSGG
nr:hypothetical protein [Streptomyces sp. RG38]